MNWLWNQTIPRLQDKYNKVWRPIMVNLQSLPLIQTVCLRGISLSYCWHQPYPVNQKTLRTPPKAWNIISSFLSSLCRGNIHWMQCIIRTQGGKSGFDVNWSYSLSINRACAEKLLSRRLMLNCLYPESNCEDFLVYQGFILLTEPLLIVYVHWERLYNILIFFYLISIC